MKNRVRILEILSSMAVLLFIFGATGRAQAYSIGCVEFWGDLDVSVIGGICSEWYLGLDNYFTNGSAGGQVFTAISFNGMPVNSLMFVWMDRNNGSAIEQDKEHFYHQHRPTSDAAGTMISNSNSNSIENLTAMNLDLGRNIGDIPEISTVTIIPGEPPTIYLFGTGLIVLAGLRFLSKRKQHLSRGDVCMKNTRDLDFCFIDPEIEQRAEFIAAKISTVSQLVELQAQRETFEFGKKENSKERDILSQAFHLATKKMGLL